MPTKRASSSDQPEEEVPEEATAEDEEEAEAQVPRLP